eukprot:TRINITY_DN773_c0_g1_i2.p2 TRINITY_DN773_c0_g1~~TRINITY_DN773_c0_g1_i2.p2  ORF type:complete len:137 (+),score=2.75 TRINITY_DN773_c0_g1_i2:476-886(+)
MAGIPFFSLGIIGSAHMVDLLEMKHVQVRLVDGLQLPLDRRGSNCRCLEDGSNFEPIAGPSHIDQVAIRIQRDRVWRLTLRNHVGCFLQLDELLVAEMTSIVQKLHRGTAEAAFACLRLFQLPVDNDGQPSLCLAI